MGMFLISLVAFLLLPALLIYSLIKPAKFNIRTDKNPNGKWSRGKFSAAILAVWVVSLGIGIAITPEQSTAIDIDVDEVAAEAGLEPDDYKVHENGAIEVYSKVDTVEEDILWYQDDLSEPVENVGMLDANAIMVSAKLEPSETIDSADAEGEPKKIYLFNSESSISAQLEHSANTVVLQWYMYSDEPKTTEYSQQSLKDAYKLARAMAGREGADAVMYLSNGGKYRSKPVGGYPATGQCNNGICFIHIDLKS